MPSVTDPQQDIFPEDDRLYRVFWAGELVLPEPGHSTKRFHLWLQEVDEHGEVVVGGQVVQVTESVGSIPRLPLGSYWRNGRHSRPIRSDPTRIEFLEIVAPTSWNEPVRAGDQISGASHTWINPSDIRLLFSTTDERKIRGLDAQVVSVRTTSGQEVIFPCYEIFRAFFAGTTDLAHALLGHTWNAAERDFVIGSNHHEDLDGAHWHIDLAPGVPHSAVPYLSLLRFDEAYRKAANRIYATTVNQPRSPWISAMLPIVGKTFRIRARVVPLRSRNALLVTQISGIDFSTKVASLSYSIAKRDIPVGMPVQGQEVRPPVESVAKGKPASVSRPVDRSPTKRYFQLPSKSVKFLGLPYPKRSAREERNVPIPVPGPSRVSLVPRSVSVGTPGTRPAPSSGQFTPAEERRIEDGFEEILDLIEELMANGRIDDMKECPLVRPVPDGAPSYCEFPYSEVVRPWPWTMVREPLHRPRLALVLELAVGERLVYLIETETVKRKSYCSLAIEMVNRGSLDEGVLETLLDICADAKGIWPKKLPFGEGTLLSTRVWHKRVGGSLTWNVMLYAFARLEQARAALGEGGAKGLEL
jgi:hypothetical protein